MEDYDTGNIAREVVSDPEDRETLVLKSRIRGVAG